MGWVWRWNAHNVRNEGRGSNLTGLTTNYQGCFGSSGGTPPSPAWYAHHQAGNATWQYKPSQTNQTVAYSRPQKSASPQREMPIWPHTGPYLKITRFGSNTQPPFLRIVCSPLDHDTSWWLRIMSCFVLVITDPGLTVRSIHRLSFGHRWGKIKIGVDWYTV